LFHSITINDKTEIYKPILPDALTCFKNELEIVSGKCILCTDEKDLYKKIQHFVFERRFSYLFCRDKNLISKLETNNIPYSTEQKDFEAMQAGITTCEFLIARTGSVMVSSASPSGRQMYVFPPVHIVVAQMSQLVNYVEDALLAIQQKYGNDLPSAITIITGPSRTADIEKTLVLGAHGPKEIVVFILTN
jgi:L-lactate dehydrogenase complex protein LldG